MQRIIFEEQDPRLRSAEKNDVRKKRDCVGLGMIEKLNLTYTHVKDLKERGWFKGPKYITEERNLNDPGACLTGAGLALRDLMNKVNEIIDCHKFTGREGTLKFLAATKSYQGEVPCR